MSTKNKFSNYKLLIEGSSDLYVIAKLCELKNVPHNFEFVNLKSISNLKIEIAARLNESELKKLGIVVDADENLSKIWNIIKKYFSDFNYNLPSDLPKEGLIVDLETIKIGVWIMPNNNLNGTLEDFLNYFIPKNDLLIDEVEAHIQTIENKNLHKYNKNKRTKAKIHSWLSLQKDPGNTLGEAINQRYFDIENNECELFIEWLRKLFN
jgi:hypothetical protein